MKKSILTLLSTALISLPIYSQEQTSSKVSEATPQQVLPVCTYYAPFVLLPYYYPYFGYNTLHNGFNVNIDLGVTVGFGKNNPFRGGSFFTNLSAFYVKPLNERLLIAFGTTYSRFSLWNEPYNNLSFQALARYQFNSRWDATVYGSYSTGLFGNESPHFCTDYDYTSPHITVGAQVGVKLSDSFYVSAGVSQTFDTATPREGFSNVNHKMPTTYPSDVLK